MTCWNRISQGKRGHVLVLLMMSQQVVEIQNLIEMMVSLHYIALTSTLTCRSSQGTATYSQAMLICEYFSINQDFSAGLLFLGRSDNQCFFLFFLMMLLYVYSMLNDQTSTSNSGKLSEYIKALLEEGVLLSGINLAYYSLTSISMEKVP